MVVGRLSETWRGLRLKYFVLSRGGARLPSQGFPFVVAGGEQEPVVANEEEDSGYRERWLKEVS